MKRIAALCVVVLAAAAHGDELKRYAYSWPLTLAGDSAAIIRPDASTAELREAETSLAIMQTNVASSLRQRAS